MIEPIMYFGIGFLFASLIGLVLIPLVHNRATRLTMRRIEASTPVSLTEIQADKDQLRAEFAMSTRRLEMSVDQLKARATNQLADLGKKTEAINRLKGELGEKTAAILALESREKSLRDQIASFEEEMAAKTGAMHEAMRTLSGKEAELAKLNSALGEQSYLSDSQRVEIIALRTQVDALKSQIDRYEADVKEAEDSLGRIRIDAESASVQLSAERSKAESFGSRAALLERQLLAQTAETEMLNRRVQDLETRLADQGRLLAERDYEARHLRGELENARRAEADLRAEVATADQRYSTATATLRAGKTLVEDELKRARDERTNLQRELAALQREAEATWASERGENALLRERITEIATEVARLTMVLEGPSSPIAAILAQDNTRADANGKHPAHAAPAAGVNGNLADRIRALQARVSRASPPA